MFRNRKRRRNRNRKEETQQQPNPRPGPSPVRSFPLPRGLAPSLPFSLTQPKARPVFFFPRPTLHRSARPPARRASPASRCSPGPLALGRFAACSTQPLLPGPARQRLQPPAPRRPHPSLSLCPAGPAGRTFPFLRPESSPDSLLRPSRSAAPWVIPDHAGPLASHPCPFAF